MRRTSVTASILCVAAITLAACGNGGSGSNSASSSSGSGSGNGSGRSLTVGVLNSFSGAFSAGFAGVQQGVDARLKSYAASGGKCSGVKINTVQGDDQSSPQGALAASQKLVQSDNVYAILNSSAFIFGAGQFLTTTAKTTPVLGGGYDGAPQWLDKNAKNLFPVPAVADYHNVWDTQGQYFKKVGATKVAGVGFDTPSSSASIEATKIAAQSAGLQTGYINEKLPNGTTDVGAVVLGIQQSGADAVALSVTPPTAFAIAAGLKQAGVKMKSILAFTGYGADLLESAPAVAAGQGVSFQVSFTPIDLNTPATQEISSALKQYAGSASGIPSFSQSQGWFSADLLIHGLEGAGCNASQAQLLSFLQKDKTYNAGGLLPTKIDFSNRANGGQCIYVTTLQGNTFVTDPNTKPLCGKPTGKNVSGY
jgi:ABC-type branched-subunit amino acid transport system substrate-binding protein